MAVLFLGVIQTHRDAGRSAVAFGLIVLALLVPAGAPMAGCNCTAPPSTFTVWIGGAPQEVDYWTALIGDFERESGTTVRLVRQPTDSNQRRQGLVLSLASRQPDPDVFLMDVVWIAQFALSGWLEPLDPYIHESGFSTAPFFEPILDQADRYAGSLYALPVYVDGGVLYYRRDLLEQFGYSGPPQTWDALRQMAGKIQEAQRGRDPQFNGFVWSGAQYEGAVCCFLEFAASNGGGFLTGSRLDLASAPNQTALQWMQDAIHLYRISPPNTFTEMREEQVRLAFQQGRALFERNWPYAWKLHQQADSPVRGRIGIAPLPHFPGGGSASTLGGWHAGISRTSDRKALAWQFVRFVVSYDTQKKLATHLGWNPGRRDLYSDHDLLSTLPHLATLREAFDNAVARPTLPYYTQVSSVIQRYLNNCVAGRQTPGQALQAMQQGIDRISRIYEE